MALMFILMIVQVIVCKMERKLIQSHHLVVQQE